MSQDLEFITNGICSCGDKVHGATGWKTGQFCPILAVPLNLHFIP